MSKSSELTAKNSINNREKALLEAILAALKQANQQIEDAKS